MDTVRSEVGEREVEGPTVEDKEGEGEAVPLSVVRFTVPVGDGVLDTDRVPSTLTVEDPTEPTPLNDGMAVGVEEEL